MEATLPGIIEAAPPKRPLTVSETTEMLKEVLARGVPSTLCVVGEVTNFSDRGHWYFSLKDERDVLSCVMWASSAKRCAFTPERGQQVVATGNVDYYGPQGRLQFYARKVEPVGQGVLDVRFRRLCEELQGLGYFDESRKRPMPPFPEHIAVITSAGGAALQDVIRTARQRWAGIRISVVDVRVQGEGAAAQIARAVTHMGKRAAAMGVDAIILTRGGGSMEDLWAFNERIVADAVYRCAAPIAVGVGHETDLTIAELVADLRCSTPTQAASRLVPSADAERQRVDQYTHALARGLRRMHEHVAVRLRSLETHPVLRRPMQRIGRWRDELLHRERALASALRQRAAILHRTLDDAHHGLGRIEPVSRLVAARQRLTYVGGSLAAALPRRVAALREALTAIERRLSGVGHHNVLSRGYTYTTDTQGQVLRTVDAARRASALNTHFPDGQVRSTVSETASRSPPLQERKSRTPSSQHGLFDEAS